MVSNNSPAGTDKITDPDHCDQRLLLHTGLGRKIFSPKITYWVLTLLILQFQLYLSDFNKHRLTNLLKHNKILRNEGL